MRQLLLLMGISMAVCAFIPASGTTLYVDGSVSASGNGQSWETALKTIQEGIDGASDGDTVIVAPGTYVENIHFDGKNIILRSTDPLDPDVVANTIIDGNQTGSVVTFSGDEDETCVLSGFTIRDGKAEKGGGVCGGTEETHTHATIQNNVITGNWAEFGGGLVYCDGTIRDNTISGNSAGERGGGLYSCDGVIENSTIIGNTANFGGGLYDSDATIRNNLIIGNSAACGGGLHDCDAGIENNTICGNSAASFGGGVRLCRGTIQNCIVWGNSAAYDAQLSRCKEPAYSCIQNWPGGGEGNVAEDPQFVDADGPDDNPKTYEDNDYRLAAGSPCIDAGKNEDWMSGAADMDGHPRIINETVDMGAYEYGVFLFEIVAVAKLAGDEVEIRWNSQPREIYTVLSCVDLSTGGWIEEETVPSQGGTTSWKDTAPVESTKFYRVGME